MHYVQPRLVFIGWPCTYWSSLTYINFRIPETKQKLRRLRQKELPFLRLAESIFVEQTSRGDHALGGNPWPSLAWRTAPIKRTLKLPGVYDIKTDMCMHNLRHPKSGVRLKKPTRLAATHPQFFVHLGLTCSGKHTHDACMGGAVAKAAGQYTKLFGRRTCDALHAIIDEENILDKSKRVHGAHPTDPAGAHPNDNPGADPTDLHAQGDDPQDVLGARAISFNKRVSKPVQQFLRRLHRNLGHPSNVDLARDLRLNGAKQDVEAAKHLTCQTCLRLAPRGVPRLAAVQRTGDFNDEVGFDMLFVRDTDGKQHMFLSVVDLSTTYHVLLHCPNRFPATVADCFNNLWVTWAGPPSRGKIDQDGGFRQVFEEALESFGIVGDAAAGQAPWQHGRTERQGACFKEMFTRVVQHTSVREIAEVKIAVSCTAAAKNFLRRRCGFSPNQWVMGRGPRLPADLVGETQDVSGHSRALESDQLARRYRIRTAARCAFVEMQNDDSLRRALLARSRVHRGDFEPGTYVYWWRIPKHKTEGVWRGPGVVIGNKGDSVWVSCGTYTILCAREQLREAVSEELWAPGLDETSLVQDLGNLQQRFSRRHPGILWPNE